MIIINMLIANVDSAKCSATLPGGVSMLFQLLPINFDLSRYSVNWQDNTLPAYNTNETNIYRRFAEDRSQLHISIPTSNPFLQR